MIRQQSQGTSSVLDTQVVSAAATTKYRMYHSGPQMEAPWPKRDVASASARGAPGTLAPWIASCASLVNCAPTAELNMLTSTFSSSTTSAGTGSGARNCAECAACADAPK